jgi:hypothetical protein
MEERETMETKQIASHMAGGGRCSGAEPCIEPAVSRYDLSFSWLVLCEMVVELIGPNFPI